MGGHAAGEVASEMAVEMVSHELSDLNDLGAPDVYGRVSRALRDANRAVYERTRTERDKLGMGSTVSALLLSETKFLVGHVGDSRIYLVRDGQMRQLTKDLRWSRSRSMRASSPPSRQGATRRATSSPAASAWLTRSSPMCSTAKRASATRFCSPATGSPGWSTIGGYSSSPLRAKPERYVDALIQEANVNGGNDNITAVVVRVLSAESNTDHDITPVPPARTHG